MRKNPLALLLCFFILISGACLIGSQNTEPQTSSDQLPSAFDMLAQGTPIYILRDEGKENLRNYREQFRIEITGVNEAGDTANGFQEYLVEMDKPADLRREISTMLTPNDYMNGTLEYVVSTGLIYHVGDAFSGGRICTREEVSAETQSHISDYVIRPLTSITPGNLLEKDVLVNNVTADVYEIDEIGLLTFRNITNINAKVWIARKPAFLLKAEGTVEGQVEWDNRIYTGQAKFTYEVKDFDQVKIELPPLCAHPPEEMIPVPANATDIRSNPPRLNFYSSDTADQVKSFYLKELAAQGWVVSEIPSDGFGDLMQASITSPQGLQILLRIRIHPMGGGGSSVDIDWQVQ
ncbi:MAG: hypothetical protein A2Z71_01690 [Chloroflexi bacterium RBG_13_50_21]|nr:MAG: hypothetical protein A2Z71_01690 [Chloroflexi bacterium RBG_13_50_21]OGO60999.1 MAG: hypothetical protein A2029_03265 [Chloroflexi bacterium RBG_19FT_COMBO_47_9]